MNTANDDPVKQVDRLFPDLTDALQPVRDHLAQVRQQLAGAQGSYNELAAAVGRCEADITAPRDVEQQIAALVAKRTDAIANSYLKNLVLGTSTKKLDADIAALQTSLVDLKARAEGAAQARSVLLSQLVTARQAMEALQHDAARLQRQITGRAPTPAETAEYEQEVYAQLANRRAAATPEAVARRQEELTREERMQAEKARQQRQRNRKDGPLA